MKHTFRSQLALWSLLTLAGNAQAQTTIKLQLIANVDLTPTADSANAAFIGNNISALAWNGSTAWVGGYNNGVAGANTAIVAVTNVLGTPVIGTPFGVLSTPNSRGLTGLAIKGNTLAAAYDPGSNTSDAIRAFDTVTGNLLWNLSGLPSTVNTKRGSGGVAFDPGYKGSSPSAGNVATLYIGSGRRALYNATTGAYIYGLSGETGASNNGGMIINTNPVATTWRGISFDPETGDIYTRESNRVTKGTRSGENTISGSSVVLAQGNNIAGSVDNQHLTFAKVTAFGDAKVVFYNNRPGNTTTPFATAVSAVDTAGNAVTLDFGTFTAPDGASAYDFNFDPTSQTLAIADFTARHLYVFKVGKSSTVTGTLNFSAGLISPTAPNQTITMVFRPTGTTNVGFTKTLSIPATGAFTIPDVPVGTYTVHITGLRYLAANVDINTNSDVTLPAIDLLGGDVQQPDSTGQLVADNVINVDDLSALLFLFNTTMGDGMYDTNPSADVNDDGSINVDDLSILLYNFNVNGAP